MKKEEKDQSAKEDIWDAKGIQGGREYDLYSKLNGRAS
jgi:hypothetical protein